MTTMNRSLLGLDPFFTTPHAVPDGCSVPASLSTVAIQIANYTRGDEIRALLAQIRETREAFTPTELAWFKRPLGA